MARRWEIDDQVARRLARANAARVNAARSNADGSARGLPFWRRGGFRLGLVAVILIGVWAVWGHEGFLSSQGSVRAGVLPVGDSASPGESPMSSLSLENSRLATVAASAAVAFAAVSYSPEIDASFAQGTGSCEGDINGDGAINGIDLSYVLVNWGTCNPPPPPLPRATTLEALPDPAVVTDEALRNAIIAAHLPWRVRDNASNIEMLLVPPGTFMMGCSASTPAGGCSPDESPVHQVTLTSAFYLGKTEVTQAQWVAEMGSNPSEFSTAADSPSRPAEHVSWDNIQGFLSQNSLRLPTEAEWEYAYRAGTNTAFHNGSSSDATLGTIAWFSANSSSQTHTVGGKLANRVGLHDMSGNVWEWVSDWYGGYTASSVVDPTGPTSGSKGVVRGGGWNIDSTPQRCRASSRPNDVPRSSVRPDFGFRVARNP